ncbi:MAG: arginase family protein [Candidatus Aenigmatarchaeota archaeon]
MRKTERKLFGIDLFDEKEAEFFVIGLKYTKYSEKILNEFRKWSEYVEPFDIIEEKNLSENLKIFDLGNLDLDGAKNTVRRLINEGKIPIILSRGHFPTFLILSNIKNFKLIVFDAHADCKERYIDEIIEFDTIYEQENKIKFNGATWLRRFLEKNRIDVLLIGVRSLDEDEFNFLKRSNVLYFSPADLEKEETFEIIRKFTKHNNLYLSIDVDVFDPSLFSSTDYPEPEGINLTHFRKILDSIEGKIIGVDFCCFNLEGLVKQSYIFASKCLYLVLYQILKNKISLR